MIVERFWPTTKDKLKSFAVLPVGQKILTFSRILTTCFKWSKNTTGKSEEETNTIVLTLYNTLIHFNDNR